MPDIYYILSKTVKNIYFFLLKYLFHKQKNFELCKFKSINFIGFFKQIFGHTFLWYVNIIVLANTNT